MPTENDKPPLIVVRNKKHSEPHHGGAWKVAYADFVTAMMAFFLLLWLLNVTTDDQKLGIAQSFAPENVSRSTSGAGGILGGNELSDASMPRGSEGPVLGIPVSPVGQPDNAEAPDTTDPPKEVDDPTIDATLVTNATADTKGAGTGAGATADELRQALARKEDADFAAAERQLERVFDAVPDLQPLRQNLIVDRTPEGLRIQIVDQDRTPMFPVGSPVPNEQLQRLVGLVAQAVGRLPNPISITGHTDSLPYPAGAQYTNWELSLDRANACRRALIAAGVPQDHVKFVRGKADTEPLVADATDPRNRRISFVLLRDEVPSGSGAVAKSVPPSPLRTPGAVAHHPAVSPATHG